MKKPILIITQARILHLLTVFVIVPLSGVVSSLVAKYFPGLPNFSANQIEAVFIAGATVALGAAIHYLHGWALWERTGGKFVDVEADDAPKQVHGV